MASGDANIITEPKDVIRENLKFLQEYARRLLVEEDDSLVPIEDFKDILMKEYLSVGASLGLTKRDLMVLIFKDMLSKTLDPQDW